jgi:hypothetical protein
MTLAGVKSGASTEPGQRSWRRGRGRGRRKRRRKRRRRQRRAD